MFLISSANDFVGPDKECARKEGRVFLEAGLKGDWFIDLELLLGLLFHTYPTKIDRILICIKILSTHTILESAITSSCICLFPLTLPIFSNSIQLYSSSLLQSSFLSLLVFFLIINLNETPPNSFWLSIGKDVAGRNREEQSTAVEASLRLKDVSQNHYFRKTHKLNHNGKKNILIDCFQASSESPQYRRL